MAAVGVVPTVINCETSRRRGGRPRASRRGSTGGIGLLTVRGDDEMILMKNNDDAEPRRRRASNGGSYRPAFRRSSGDVLNILEHVLQKNKGDTSELLDPKHVSPNVLPESPRISETPAKHQRRYSGSHISADVWKPNKSKSSDESASGRRSEPPLVVTCSVRTGSDANANASGRSGKSSQQSLDQHKAFISSHRAVNNAPGRRPRGNSSTSNPTITNSAITTRRRNSAPSADIATRQKPPPIDEIVFKPQEIVLPAGDTIGTAPIDPRDEEIDDLKHAVKSSQRSIQVLTNEIRMLKEANKRLIQERQQQEDACQKEVTDLKNELKTCYKKNISLSKSSRADTATIERLHLELDKRDMTIATLHDS